jgi:hypothetical protein
MDAKKGPLVNERPKSREETPKVGSDTAVPLPCIWAYSVCCAMAGQPRRVAFNNSVTRRPLKDPLRCASVESELRSVAPILFTRGCGIEPMNTAGTVP